MKIGDVIKSPKITEKSIQSTQKSVYSFYVSEKANKNEIKKAVEEFFKVKVGKVRTSIRVGKTRKVGKRQKIKKLPKTKTAFVYLKEGKIDVFPKT